MPCSDVIKQQAAGKGESFQARFNMIARFGLSFRIWPIRSDRSRYVRESSIARSFSIYLSDETCFKLSPSWR
jgi:hypothetical protein